MQPALDTWCESLYVLDSTEKFSRDCIVWNIRTTSLFITMPEYSSRYDNRAKHKVKYKSERSENLTFCSVHWFDEKRKML